MKIIAQSQTPTKVSYIHLAYVSASLSKTISKGELLPIQAVLAAGLAAAIACGSLGAKLAEVGKRARAAKIGAAIGFVGMLGAFGAVNFIWSNSLSKERVVNHIIQSRQWWALRDPEIAAGVEAAAITNGAAASLAVSYYYLKHGSMEEHPEYTVKAYKYAEEALDNGSNPGWIRAGDVTNDWGHLMPSFKAALDKGKLTLAEQNWTKQKLVQMDEQSKKEDQSDPKK